MRSFAGAKAPAVSPEKSSSPGSKASSNSDVQMNRPPAIPRRKVPLKRIAAEIARSARSPAARPIRGTPPAGPPSAPPAAAPDRTPRSPPAATPPRPSRWWSPPRRAVRFPSCVRARKTPRRVPRSAARAAPVPPLPRAPAPRSTPRSAHPRRPRIRTRPPRGSASPHPSPSSMRSRTPLLADAPGDVQGIRRKPLDPCGDRRKLSHAPPHSCFSSRPLQPAPNRRPARPWMPIPELTDEFDGEVLDAAKWHDHNPTWQGRKPGYFRKIQRLRERRETASLSRKPRISPTCRTATIRSPPPQSRARRSSSTATSRSNAGR